MSAQVISLLDRLPNRRTKESAPQTQPGSELAKAYPQLAPTLKRFVRALTRDLLGREPTPGESEDWVRQMLDGSSRKTVATCLVNSEEYRRRIVHDWYDLFLQREPDAEGLKFWTELLGSKGREQALTAFLTTPEYVVRGGGDNDRFVRALYRDLLGRKPSQTEVSSWVGLLNSQSASRMCVANSFLTSREYRERGIRRWYLELLNREPAVDTLRHHLELYRQGESQETLLVALVSGSEYFSRSLSRSDLP